MAANAETVQYFGNRWKVLCSKNLSATSACQKEGHTMFTRKEAVRSWNELDQW